MISVGEKSHRSIKSGKRSKQKRRRRRKEVEKPKESDIMLGCQEMI